MSDHVTQAEHAQLRIELATLRSESAALRSELEALRSQRSLAQVAEAKSRRENLSRRGLLLGGGAVAAAAIVSVATATPAAATTGNMQFGAFNFADGSKTYLESTNQYTTLELENSGTQGASALFARSSNGPGVEGSSYKSNGIEGVAINTDNPFNGVYGHTPGKGNGVFGESTGTDKTGSGVLGIARGTGNSVFGFKDTDVKGDAVVGYTKGPGRGIVGISALGRGGVFTGKPAQLQLTPSSAASHPSSGLAGDLFVDSAKRLWFCKGGTTWKLFA